MGITGSRRQALLVVSVLAVAATSLRGWDASAARGADARVASHAGPVAAAVAYLRRAQNADGGFGAAPGQRSDPLFTGWTALGLAAAGRRVTEVQRGRSLLAYVRSHVSIADVGGLERTILVAGAAGADPRAFGGHDLVAALTRRFGRAGSVAGQVNLTAFGVLALRAAGAEPGLQTRGRRWLARAEDRDGGFGPAPRGQSDADDTGAVLQALAGDRAARAVRGRAVAYLRRHQDRDGGFPSAPGMGSNAQSTAWAIQGLEAAGIPARRIDDMHRAGRRSPLSYLRGLVGAGGAIRYSRSATQTPVWVTAEALMALAGRPLPLAAPRARRSQGGGSAGGGVTRSRHATSGRRITAPRRPSHVPARRSGGGAGAKSPATGTGSRAGRGQATHPGGAQRMPTGASRGTTATVAGAVTRMETNVTALPARVLAAVMV